jgi:gas vesicle protein
MKTDDKSKLSYLMVGLGVGALATLMFALRMGENTRKYLRERGSKGLDALNQQARKLRERADEIVSKGKEIVGRPADSVNSSTEGERQDYEEKKRENMGG